MNPQNYLRVIGTEFQTCEYLVKGGYTLTLVSLALNLLVTASSY